MNRAMSTVVLVLSMLAVEFCHCQTAESLTCDQLPKVEIPSLKVLIPNSPLRFDYTLTKTHDCSTKVITDPGRGVTNYHGTVLNIRGSEVIVKSYFVNSDKKTAGLETCSTGEKPIWYMSAAQFGDNGGFYCSYTCDDKALKEFSCLSNNNGTSQAELDAVEMAKKVPNGDKIHEAWENCPASKGCHSF